jgi:inosine-uridine nucleoside N-ribohydrolase
VAAQTPPSFRIPPAVFEDVEPGEDAELPEIGAAGMQKVIIDTDPGVDDAAALIWLLSQDRYPLNVLGIATVGGNTNVDQATYNVQLLLNWTGRTDIPIVTGKTSPLPLSSTTKLIHGPDGLGGLTFVEPPVSEPVPLPVSVEDFYCAQLPGTGQEPVIVIALGPLTNLQAVLAYTCPDGKTIDWSLVRIVSLGGAKFGGNQTPVTEFNYWQDPFAARDTLMVGGLPFPPEGFSPIGPQITQVPVDAFRQFILSRGDLKQLEKTGVPAIQKLFPALEFYLGQVADENGDSALPDPVAAIYALDPRLGTGQSALVKVTTPVDGQPEYLRGQTVVGLGFAERLTMIASDQELSANIDALLLCLFLAGDDPDAQAACQAEFEAALGAYLFSEPDNATFVTDIQARHMRSVFVKGLTQPPAWGHNRPGRDDDGEVDDSALDGTGNRIYVPFVPAP